MSLPTCFQTPNLGLPSRVPKLNFYCRLRVKSPLGVTPGAATFATDPLNRSITYAEKLANNNEGERRQELPSLSVYCLLPKLRAVPVCCYRGGVGVEGPLLLAGAPPFDCRNRSSKPASLSSEHRTSVFQVSPSEHRDSVLLPSACEGVPGCSSRCGYLHSRSSQSRYPIDRKHERQQREGAEALRYLGRLGTTSEGDFERTLIRSLPLVRSPRSLPQCGSFDRPLSRSPPRLVACTQSALVLSSEALPITLRNHNDMREGGGLRML